MPGPSDATWPRFSKQPTTTEVAYWLRWRTGLSRSRAGRLTQIARRVDDLPACVALFKAGRLSEDAMAILALKLPAERDQEIADLAPDLLHSQLSRIPKHLPPNRAVAT